MKTKLFVIISLCLFHFSGMAMTSFSSTSVNAYRWRNDNGSEASATWRRAANTNDTITRRSSNIRLRVGLNIVGGGSSPYPITNTYQLWCVSPVYGNYQVSTTSSEFQLASTTNFADGDTTTNQFGYTPFLTGKCISSNNTFTVPNTDTTSTELEYCLKAATQALNYSNYVFYIVNSGSPFSLSNDSFKLQTNFPVSLWAGGTSTDWNNPINWANDTVPGNYNNDVLIPGGTTYQPVLTTGTASLASLTMGPGSSLSLFSSSGLYVTDSMTIKPNAVLSMDGTSSGVLNGILTDNGVINGSGHLSINSLYYNGAIQSQYIIGNGSVNNLQLFSNFNITSGSNLKVTGTLTLNYGLNIFTGGALTLASNASGTARIDPVQSGYAITGNVNVQQYIPGGRRAFRFLGHPFSSAISLSQLEDSMDVTGTGGSANGFTNTGSNNSSAFWYNPATGNGSTVNDSTGWIPFTSTNGTGANAWNAYEGIRVLVRGAKGQGLNGAAYTPLAVTLNMNGIINSGNVSEHLNKGTNSGFNLLSNPYPSPTDIGTVILADTAHLSGSGYWVWDANMQTQGAYVVHQKSSGAFVIPANTAFVVNALDTSSLNFGEYNKSATVAAPLLKSTTQGNNITLNLYDSTGNIWDGLYLSFNERALNKLENNDARKLHNTALDFYSVSADNQKLSIDARPFTGGGVIPLGIVTTTPQQFTIKAEGFAAPAGRQLFLHDKYLDIYQLLTAGTAYTFTITGDAESQGDNRFEISMRDEATSVSNTVASSFGIILTPNPAAEQVTISYNADKAQPATIYIADVTGKSIMTKKLGNTQTGTTVISLHNLAAGMYMVTFTSGDHTITQKLIKQ